MGRVLGLSLEGKRLRCFWYVGFSYLFTYITGKLTYKLVYAFGATTYISDFSMESWEHS